jgi:hypothetical protein
MGWPRHNYAYIVLGGDGKPLRSNGAEGWYEGGFGEVFADKKSAEWVANQERHIFKSLASHAPVRQLAPPVQKTATRDVWIKKHDAVTVCKIALPGTYTQFQIPGALERKLAREAKVNA